MTLTISKELLDELAPYDPIAQDVDDECVWCAGGAERNSWHHARNCPWVRARALLNDRIE